MNKAFLVVGGLLGFGLVAYAGVTQYSGSQFVNTVKKIESAQISPALKLTSTESRHGFLRSTGKIAWEIQPACRDDIGLASGTINYTVAHTPSFAGASAIDATISVEGELAKLMGKEQSIQVASISGTRKYSGNWVSEFSTPKMSFDVEGSAVRISASKGSWVTQGASADVNWSIGQVNASANGGDARLSIKNVVAQAHVSDIVLGLGNVKYATDLVSVEGNQGAVEMTNLLLTQTTSANGASIDTVVSPSVGSVKFHNQEYKNLGMKVSIRGIDQQAANDLATLQRGSSCMELASLSNDKFLIIEKAIANILDRGWEFAIDDLKAEVDQGSLAGHFKVALSGTKGNGESLASRINADAKLTALGAIIPPGFDQMLLGTGYVVPAPGDTGVSSSFSLNNGEVKINGQSNNDMDSQLEFFLDIGDDQMQQWRANLDQGQSVLVGLAGGLK